MAKISPAVAGLFSYQGNFDRLAVGFGQLVQMSEVDRFDADFQQVDNIGRYAGQLFNLCQRQVRTDSGIAQLAAMPFLILTISWFLVAIMFNSFNVLLKQNRPQNESGGVDNCTQTARLFARKAAYLASSSTKEVIIGSV